MKYKYTIERVPTNWETEFLVMKLPPEINAVASFISEITLDLAGWYLEGFERVLSGEEDYQERDGEFLGSQIRKNTTKIYDMFGGDYETCEIETKELKELIEIWVAELKAFKSS